MATKKTATKTSQKAKLNIDDFIVNAASSKSGKRTTKRTTKEVNKVVKKASAGGIVLAIVFLLIGAAIGIGGWFFVCKNDEFSLIGEDEITLTLDEKYTDDGVKIVEFGKDNSNKIVIGTNLKVDANGKYYSEEVGTFYIAYKADTIIYGKLFSIQKVRLITFVEASEQVEVD